MTIDSNIFRNLVADIFVISDMSDDFSSIIQFHVPLELHLQNFGFVLTLAAQGGQHEDVIKARGKLRCRESKLPIHGVCQLLVSAAPF
jgi:hypothetical protein